MLGIIIKLKFILDFVGENVEVVKITKIRIKSTKRRQYSF
jgi:hypothetical protein